MSCPVMNISSNLPPKKSSLSSKQTSGSTRTLGTSENELSRMPKSISLADDPDENEQINQTVTSDFQPSPDPKSEIATADSHATVNNQQFEGKSPEDSFRNGVALTSKQVYKIMFAECEQIEGNISSAEEQVINKTRTAFLARRFEMEYSAMEHSQAKKLESHRSMLEQSLKARQERKEAKRQARQTIRATKKRDTIIQHQETSAAAALRNREAFQEKRAAFDLLTNHMYEVHEKQRKNLIAAQDRRLLYEKALHDFETKHLKQELRSTLAKKFHVRQTYQIALDKRINDQLREFQLMELRHIKERFEIEMTGFEEENALKIRHSSRLFELRSRHVDEHHNEKEFLRTTHEATKLQHLQKMHGRELKALANEHRIALRQLKIKHDQVLGGSQKGSSAGSQSGSRCGSNGGSKIGSAASSAPISRQLSSESLDSKASQSFKGSVSSFGGNNGNQKGSLGLAVQMMERTEEDEDDENVTSTKTTSKALVQLVKRHVQEIEALKTLIQQELNDFQLSQEAKLQELEEKQDLDAQKLVEIQRIEIADMKAVQEKEIVMEEAMHDTEMKALLERKILNSILDTVDDGIINIGTDGTLMRFNQAAERIFGYTAEEVIGKNIKILMPDRYAEHHDVYMNNYLTSGIKKVIGIPNGRRVLGLKKGGIEFHLQLSVSELKTDDSHMFTGIARDLTEEVRIEEEIKAKEEGKKKEFDEVVRQLDFSKSKVDEALSQLLPPSISDLFKNGQIAEPQSFECATILFLDIVGFTAICSKLEPQHTVSLLNGIYTLFDDVIGLYDAYKVETAGDRYMVASGLPRLNGKRHAAEIVSMALHILSVASNYQFKNDPSISIKLRIGISTGPVVAGVVGLKVPRYCLFGETVNAAARMESTGKPNKIQISESTLKMLKESGGFETRPRVDDNEVNAKGKKKAYFVIGKDGFNLPLPEDFSNFE